MARAVAESSANPTEGGLYLNTEYTFFWGGGREHATSVPERGISKTYEECVSNDPGRSGASELKECTDTHITGNLRHHKVRRADAPTPSTERKRDVHIVVASYKITPCY